MASPTPVSHDGRLHYVPPGVGAFEFAHPSKATHDQSPANLLLWIGGLMDTWGTVEYPAVLASRLAPTWSLALVYLSSWGKQWGVASLDTDVAELSAIIHYFRSIGVEGKVVLMGYSTGCQDAMHYLVSPGERPQIDGVILQAPVSDREIMRPTMGDDVFLAGIAMAEEWVTQGKAEDCLPMPVTQGFMPGVPVSARRFLSLAKRGGQDDYFSSDLSDVELQASFGSIRRGTHSLLMSGAEDQYVPKTIDVPTMLGRWIRVATEAGVVVDENSSQQVPRGTHSSNERPDAIKVITDRVLHFLNGVNGI